MISKLIKQVEFLPNQIHFWRMHGSKRHVRPGIAVDIKAILRLAFSANFPDSKDPRMDVN